MRRKSRRKLIAFLVLGALLITGFAVYKGWINLSDIFNRLPSPTGDFVSVEFYSRDALTGADQDIAWNIYDSNGNLIETATASSGKVTLGTMLREGETVILQAVANDPSDGCDPYPSVQYTVTVPFADAGDTVSLGVFTVYDASTAPTLVVTDQGANSIADTTGNYFNTSDTGFIVTITGVVSGDAYGVNDFTYAETGDHYGGLFVIWKGTASQNFAADYTLSDPTNIYYIWEIDPVINDPNDPSDGAKTIQFSVTTGSLASDASVTITLVDMAKVDASGTPLLGSLFASDIAVTAINTKVA